MEYLEDLVTVDFDAPCAAHSFCEACCPDHVPSHHGMVAGPPRTIPVVLLEGRFPAVTAHSVRTRGFGYAWTHIQRAEYQGTSYVMLGREQPKRNRGWMRGRCTNCDDRIPVDTQYCSPSCKVARVPHGQSRDVIQSLVNCDFGQSHLLDRFCTVCRRAFSSHHCSDHAQHHPGVEDLQVFTILRHHRWVLIPEDQLPDVLD